MELLRTAKKPVILLGSQATLPPTHVDSLRHALEVPASHILCIIGVCMACCVLSFMLPINTAVTNYNRNNHNNLDLSRVESDSYF